jgi:sugar phosphate permease
VPAQPIDRPTSVRWTIFTLACGTSWLLYLHRYLFGLIKGDLEREWGLSNTELGLLDSAQSTAYGLFQFPLGIAADVAGVRLVMTVLMLVWCLGLTLFAFAPTPLFLWIGRVIFGLGQSAIYPALSRVAQVWFPPKVRTTLTGIVAVTFGRLGGLASNLLFAALLVGLLGFDWRTAVVVLVAAGVGWALLFWFDYRNAPREHPRVNPAEAAVIAGENPLAGEADRRVPAAEPKLSVAQMLRGIKPRALLNLIALNIQTILSTLADNIFVSWIPKFLLDEHKLKYAEMGLYSALPLLGGAIAGFIGGALNDWCIVATGSRRWSRIVVAASGKGLAALTLLAALAWYQSPYVFCGFLFAVKLFSDWSLTSSWGVVTDIGGRATASLFGFNNAIATLGAIVAAPMFGYLADHYGWFSVFVTVAITYLLCALSWLPIDSTVPMVETAPAHPSAV